MSSDSVEFITTLFARASVGAMALTALPADGRGAITCHVPLTHTTLLAEAVSRLHGRNERGAVNAFLGIATRRTGLTRYQRGGKADLLELPALFADIDRPPAEVYPLLARFRPPPSLVVASGFGTHVYWLLAEPTTNFHQCDAILSGLARALGGDRLTVAQSMRLPGTRNFKPGRGPCYILESQPQRCYSLGDFAPYLPPQREVHLTTLASGTHLDDLAAAISGILVSDYEGHLKANGWIAARCPAGHASDHPGKHFFFNEALHLGHCFGRHGRFLLKELTCLLGQNRRFLTALH